MGVQEFEALMIDKRTNKPFSVKLRMDMQPDEVANQVRKELGTKEPIEFILRRPDGDEYEIATPDARTIWEIMQGGSQIFVDRRPIYGLTKFQRHVDELKRIYRSIFYNQSMHACVVWGRSKIDHREYQVTIYEPKNDNDYPSNPPLVIIKPFPSYVYTRTKYENNHVRACCWQMGEFCQLHIDGMKWDEIRIKYVNPLIGILENVIQALDIEPFRIY